MSRHLAARSLPFLATLASACAPDPTEVALDDRLRGDEVYGTAMRVEGRSPSTASGFNAFILGAAKSFGPGAYLWEGDGVTRAITYQGTTIAKPYSPEKCHCVGATFQVYMTAFEAWDKQYGKSSGSLKGLSVAQVQQLKQIWYVATPALEGSQAALSSLGLGAAVKSLGQAQQGDLAQIWRNNGSGHSVMFDSWVLDAGKIVGINYFSCQGGGPAFVSEVVGTGTKEVDAGRIYVGHPFPPVDMPAEDGGGDTARRDEGPRADGADARRVDMPPGDLALEPRVESQGCGCSSAPSTGSGLLLGLAVVALLACRRR
jgi:MYXO-CTERM domain-containing protein